MSEYYSVTLNLDISIDSIYYYVRSHPSLETILHMYNILELAQLVSHTASLSSKRF